MNRMTYQSLRAQMALRGHSITTLSQEAGIRYNTLCRKLRGEHDFTLREALRIRNTLKFTGPLEELFSQEGENR